MIGLPLKKSFSSNSAHQEVLVFCPFWIINRTDLDLTIRDSVDQSNIAGLDLLNQKSTESVPLMFSFKDNQKRKLELSVKGSAFSKVCEHHAYTFTTCA